MEMVATDSVLHLVQWMETKWNRRSISSRYLMSQDHILGCSSTRPHQSLFHQKLIFNFFLGLFSIYSIFSHLHFSSAPSFGAKCFLASSLLSSPFPLNFSLVLDVGLPRRRLWTSAPGLPFDSSLYFAFSSSYNARYLDAFESRTCFASSFP